jgi:hypothetical protein
MLERYFVQPSTLDRIRASWVGEHIERYVIWLTEHRYRASTIHGRVPMLFGFGAFVYFSAVAKLHHFEITPGSTGAALFEIGPLFA